MNKKDIKFLKNYALNWGLALVQFSEYHYRVQGKNNKYVDFWTSGGKIRNMNGEIFQGGMIKLIADINDLIVSQDKEIPPDHPTCNVRSSGDITMEMAAEGLHALADSLGISLGKVVEEKGDECTYSVDGGGHGVAIFDSPKNPELSPCQKLFAVYRTGHMSKPDFVEGKSVEDVVAKFVEESKENPHSRIRVYEIGSKVFDSKYGMVRGKVEIKFAGI